MTGKFTLEDFFIKIIPGVTLVGVLYIAYGDKLQIEFTAGLDFFYTFLFFTFSFLVGEVIQTLANLMKFTVNVFFKWSQPSEVFLLKDNPVICNKYRQQMIEHLSEASDHLDCFDVSYKEFCCAIDKSLKRKSQYHFMKLYTKVSDEGIIKVFNRNFLLVRGITIVFIIFLGLSIYEESRACIVISFLLLMIFLWRARGMAKTLVNKTVSIYLKDK